jgi:hypothetical protein
MTRVDAAVVIGLGSLILFIRDDTGPVPEAERRDNIPSAAEGGLSIGEALRTRDFWLYTASFLLVLFALVGSNFHLAALLSDHGATATLVASVVALGSVGSILGRLLTGILLDRFSVRGVAGLFFSARRLEFCSCLADCDGRSRRACCSAWCKVAKSTC